MLDWAQRLRWLRRLIVAQLAFLSVQYEVGTTLSITGVFPSVPASPFSLGTAVNYMLQGGAVLVIHSVLGILIFADSLLLFLLALPVRIRWFRILVAVNLIFVVSAGFGGLQFMLSGFADNNASYQMSTGFIVSFVFAFLALYFLRTPIEPSIAAVPAEPAPT
jgi:hypothetical protein